MTTTSYAALALRLWQQEARNGWGGRHGSECPCLACGDLRAVLPTVLDDRRRRRTASEESCWQRGATRLRITLAEYRTRVLAGQRWCYGHKTWESRNGFGVDRRRRDGRNGVCSEFAAQTTRRRREGRAS